MSSAFQPYTRCSCPVLPQSNSRPHTECSRWNLIASTGQTHTLYSRLQTSPVMSSAYQPHTRCSCPAPPWRNSRPDTECSSRSLGPSACPPHKEYSQTLCCLSTDRPHKNYSSWATLHLRLHASTAPQCKLYICQEEGERCGSSVPGRSPRCPPAAWTPPRGAAAIAAAEAHAHPPQRCRRCLGDAPA
jgi:hypothetical protein